MSRPGKHTQVIKITVLILLVVFLIFSPLILKPRAEFGGADDHAKNTIMEVKKDYAPWFRPLWKPPSHEIESLLFALQASIGVAIIAFYLGYLVGKNKKS